MSTAEHLTVPELAAALRAQARGLYTSEAAVGLLIAHGDWLYRADFRRRYVDYTDDPDLIGIGAPMAAVLWAKVVTAINAHRIGGSSSEIQVLRVACGLVGHGKWSLRDAVDCLDHVNLGYVLTAIAHLAGWHERGVAKRIDGVFRAAGGDR